MSPVRRSSSARVAWPGGIKLDDNDRRNMLAAWMERVARNANIDYVRKKATKGRKGDVFVDPRELDELFPEQVVCEEDFRIVPANEFDFEEEWLADSFTRLPLLRQRALTMFFVEGYAVSEIAIALNCSANDVSQLMRRAKAYLKKRSPGGDGRHGK